MILLGIDPGTLKTGFGVIRYENRKCSVLDHGIIKTNSKDSLPDRLQKIFEGIKSISLKWKPDAISVENVFVKDNIRSALLLGQARGAAIAASRSHNSSIPVYEFSPREIKKALVGKGGASKDQVNMMVKIVLNTNDDIKEDAADALACATCAAHNQPVSLHSRQTSNTGVRV
jgi:crossover junction endodeoxyribonuclease RuvC